MRGNGTGLYVTAIVFGHNLPDMCAWSAFAHWLCTRKNNSGHNQAATDTRDSLVFRAKPEHSER